jgi:L-threonylcarbamoyladenylate synthase
MNTRIGATRDPVERRETVAEAVRLLAAGECVAVPTETVYGLAADALNPGAVAKIFAAKERPSFDPLIVHLPDESWIDRLSVVPSEEAALVEKLVGTFWPGPLTLVLPRRNVVPDLVTAGCYTVALRRSAHPVFQELIATWGKPLAAPSANRFGRISPTTAAHVSSELDGRIPFIIDAGPSPIGVESTIVAISRGSITVLRPGPIDPETLSEFAPIAPAPPGTQPHSPGSMLSHYAPRTPLLLRNPGEPLPHVVRSRAGLLAWGELRNTTGFARVESLSAQSDFAEAAANLFAALRRLDAAGLDLLVADRLPKTGLGIAIMDRLEKAAHHA